jgi:preprotein translocase subunit Sss1
MDAIMNFLGRTEVMVGMGLALIALIGVMIYLRMKPRDEE